jgi:apolipoprotein N-acyltransferase
MNSLLPLSSKLLLGLLSFLLVAFGQPAWAGWVGLIASAIGFALFWRILLDVPQRSNRFFYAVGWYASVQIIQLSWFISHPYLYIYGVLLFCAWLMGTQFGILALFIQRSLFQSISNLVGLAAFWTLMEWSRLFILSGLAFNPIGIALTGDIYPLQFASIGGVYLLSFWVILTNLLALRVWILGFNTKRVCWWGSFALIPYLFGVIHFQFHAQAMQRSQADYPVLSALLVQPAFSIEENMGFQSAEEARQFVIHEWHQILSIIQKHQGKSIDLIVLPENVVPYGTYYSVFPVDQVQAVFKAVFGESSLEALPQLEEPYASYTDTSYGSQWLVSNSYFAQGISNLFHADVVVGLEDAVQVTPKTYELYSAAFQFSPYSTEEASRYEKRVLVPMGEYIPFEFCRALAAQYGIQGSFTYGKSAKVFAGKVPYSPSICYEEMYGNIIREGRVLGAELLVNLTNDGWYPHSSLPKQHFDHSRLRTVENGIPLIRACNTGVTGAIDSLGRIINILGDDFFHCQSLADALHVEIPIYHYQTLYAKFGDRLVMAFCSFFILFALIKEKNKRNKI